MPRAESYRRSGKLQAGRNRLDLTGKTFEKLTVVEEAPRLNGRRRWRCVCSCGNQKTVATASLRSGHTISCGCWRRRRAELETARIFDTRQDPAGKRMRLLLRANEVAPLCTACPAKAHYTLGQLHYCGEHLPPAARSRLSADWQWNNVIMPLAALLDHNPLDDDRPPTRGVDRDRAETVTRGSCGSGGRPV
jgi:hypothetical protein